MEFNSSFIFNLDPPLANPSHIPVPAKLQRQLTALEWGELRPVIQHLYIVENKTIPEVADSLSKDCGFRPTKKQFTSKIAEWGLKKNTTKRERRELLQTMRPAEEETLIDSRGREHKRQKIERWESEVKRERLGQPRPIAGGSDAGPVEHQLNENPPPMDSRPRDEVLSLGPVVDNAAPEDDAIGEPRIWIQDPEELRHWPFARWANVDVQASPTLTRLFQELTLETDGLPDDIESLVLPAPYVEPTKQIAPGYVNCSELVRAGGEEMDLLSSSRNNDPDSCDAETGLVILPTRQSSAVKAFKSFASDAWFPSGVLAEVSQPHPSPLNELWPFPTFVYKENQATSCFRDNCRN